MINDNIFLENMFEQMVMEQLLLEDVTVNKALDTIQTSLDVIGIDPTQTIGTLADGTNSLISLLRAAFAKEKDDRKKHLINAGISAVSLVPFGDVVKLLKLRKTLRPLAKKIPKIGRRIKQYVAVKKQTDRFSD